MRSRGVTGISVSGASPGADLGGAWLHSRKAPENASEKGIGGSARSCRPLLSSSRVMATVEFVDGARSACSRIGLSWATVRGDVAQSDENKIEKSSTSRYRQFYATEKPALRIPVAAAATALGRHDLRGSTLLVDKRVTQNWFRGIHKGQDCSGVVSSVNFSGI